MRCLFLRDLRLTLRRRSDTLAALVFFVIVASLFPLVDRQTRERFAKTGNLLRGDADLGPRPFCTESRAASESGNAERRFCSVRGRILGIATDGARFPEKE